MSSTTTTVTIQPTTTHTITTTTACTIATATLLSALSGKTATTVAVTITKTM